MENENKSKKIILREERPKLLYEHVNGPVPEDFAGFVHYHQVQLNGLHISDEKPDNCCILTDGKVGYMKNIISKNRDIFLIMQLFHKVEDFYEVGMNSSDNGVYRVSELSEEIVPFSLECLKAKCFLMPYWESRYEDPENIFNYSNRDELLL